MNESDPDRVGRREALGAIAGAGAAMLGGARCASSASTPTSEPSVRATEATRPTDTTAVAPTGRVLGRTGVQVDLISLGGEGILRSDAPDDDATAMICAALEAGVRYCDTAPAYAGSEQHYGAAFRAMPGARDRVFLASKTHVRDGVGSLALLDESLRTLGTSHLDLWQLHDLRSREDLDEIFGMGGAIEAIDRAKRSGKIRFAGITGHADPAILLGAMERYDFDTVLCPINPADRRRAPFLDTVVPEARRRRMGVVGMKVLSAGRLVEDGVATVEELVRYAAAFADTLIIGCGSAREARANLALRTLTDAMPGDERTALEERIAPHARRYDRYKRA